MPQAPASRAAATTRSSWLGWSERPGQERRHADRGAHAGLDERAERAQPLARRRGARLGRAPDVVVERRHRERHRDVGAARGLGEQLGVADDQRAARDDRERLARRRAAPRGTRASAGSGPRPAGTGRSPRRSRSARPSSSAARARARSTSATFDLDADRRAVAVVGRPVGPLLERPDVTERAAVHAAHVRVQRPVERHALDAVQRDLARLLAVLDPHPGCIEHMFVVVQPPGYTPRTDLAWTTICRPVRARRRRGA